MQREQKTEKSGCLAEDRVEPEGTQGAQSIEIRKTENGDSTKARARARLVFRIYSKGMRNCESEPSGEVLYGTC